MREVGWTLMFGNDNYGAAYWKDSTSREYVEMMSRHFGGAKIVTLYVPEEEE